MTAVGTGGRPATCARIWPVMDMSWPRWITQRSWHRNSRAMPEKQLERLRPADFARRIDLMSSNPVADSHSAIESIDRNLERLNQLFLWGHWDEPRYRAERERLEGVRNDLQDASGPQRMDPKLSGLVEAWDTGDGVVRRELLATLFSDIHIREGHVICYTPRPDRHTQVVRLIDTVLYKLSVNVGG